MRSAIQYEMYFDNARYAMAYFNLINFLYKIHITRENPDSQYGEPSVEFIPLGYRGFCVVFFISNP